jgi:hypothetical protein
MSTRVSNGSKRSAAGNDSRRGQTSFNADRGGGVRVGTGIAFTSPGTIADSGNGLAIFRAGQAIEVSGSALNSRRFVVATSAAGTLTVLPAVVQTASAGPSVTIRHVD